jgi:hypothetical protein
MMRLRSLTAVAALIAGLGFAQRSDAQETMKHSGSIISIDDKAGRIVLAEVGPWKVRDGATIITYRTITVTPQTGFAIVRRDFAAPDGFPGEFVEGALMPGEIYLNDYVTIDCRHEGERLVALKITVVEVAAP